MKFAKKIEQDLVTKKLKTTKYYICPICGYMTITSEFDGKVIREFGEEDFILFPFTSLATLNGATKEYCKGELNKFSEYLQQDGAETLKQLRKLQKLK